jgi:hypothetical protein
MLDRQPTRRLRTGGRRRRQEPGRYLPTPRTRRPRPSRRRGAIAPHIDVAGRRSGSCRRSPSRPFGRTAAVICRRSGGAVGVSDRIVPGASGLGLARRSLPPKTIRLRRTSGDNASAPSTPASPPARATPNGVMLAGPPTALGSQEDRRGGRRSRGYRDVAFRPRGRGPRRGRQGQRAPGGRPPCPTGSAARSQRRHPRH